MNNQLSEADYDDHFDRQGHVQEMEECDMTKLKELTTPNSCLNKAGEDEMLFILLARDPAAPVAIAAWIEERIRIGRNKIDDPKILEAQACALR